MKAFRQENISPKQKFLMIFQNQAAPNWPDELPNFSSSSCPDYSYGASRDCINSNGSIKEKNPGWEDKIRDGPLLGIKLQIESEIESAANFPHFNKSPRSS